MKKVIEFYDNKEYEKAYSLFLELANKGDKEAQYNLGLLYNRGHGVEMDQEESFKWFLKAAENGHPMSQYIVGLSYGGYWTPDQVRLLLTKEEQEIYDKIDDTEDKEYYWQYPTPLVDADENESFYWFFEAYKNNYPEAEEKIIFDFEILNMDFEVDDKEGNEFFCYNDSILGLNKDIIDKLVNLFIEKYNQGEFKYVDYIGMLYENKYGQFHNYEEAIKWYEIGHKEHNLPFSAYRLAGIYYDGIGVKKNLSIAVILYLSAFDNGHHKKRYEGYYYVGKAIEEGGDTIDGSIEGVIKAFTLGSDINDGLSEPCLKEYYDKGYKINDKYTNKFALLNEAQKGNEEAKRKFIEIYINNREDYLWDSHKWLIEYANNGNQKAIELLFYLFYDEFYMYEEKYPIETFDFKLWLADKGDSEYQSRVAKNYELGDYIAERDYKKALYWYERAATNDIHAAIALNYNYRKYSVEKLKDYRKIPANNIFSIMKLGLIYGRGQFGVTDYLKSYNYYQEAQKQIDKSNRSKRYEAFKTYDNAASESAKKAALKGNIDAMLFLGCLYEHGFEIETDKEEAIFWYEMASKQGNLEANKRLEIIKQRK